MAQKNPTPAPRTPQRVSRSNPAAPSPVSRSRSAVAAPERPQASPARSPAPTRKKRKQAKKTNPFVLFFRGLVRRLYFGGKILSRCVLLVPILIFMVGFSYTVDRSGLFQGALAPRRIVDLMLQGYDVTNFEQMNEREVVQLFAQDVPETPEVIGIGSSRVLQFTRELVGSDSFFNMGVTGADVRDNMTSYYKMVSYGKAPKVLLWSVDPWVFYGDEAAFDARADEELYNEFLTNVLGVETDYEEPDQVELWKALAEPAYFQGNVDYYLKNRGQATVTDDEGNPIEFNPVEGDPYNQTTTIKRSDGSVLYDIGFRTLNEDQIRALAAEACPTFNSVHMEGFDSLTPTQTEAFDRFLQYARSQGTTVILVLSPWHPYLYDYLLNESELHQGFFQVEPYLRNYCLENNIPLYGSYDPSCIEGLEELDFFDGLHCKDSGIAKFFPGVPQALEDLSRGTLPDPTSVTPRTTPSLPEDEAGQPAA